jgi:hypothetical protein
MAMGFEDVMKNFGPKNMSGLALDYPYFDARAFFVDQVRLSMSQTLKNLEWRQFQANKIFLKSQHFTHLKKLKSARKAILPLSIGLFSYNHFFN